MPRSARYTALRPARTTGCPCHQPGASGTQPAKPNAQTARLVRQISRYALIRPIIDTGATALIR